MWKFTNFIITLLCELEFYKIMECLSVANFYTRSIPIGLKTGGVFMFTISPTLFFLSLQVYVEVRKMFVPALSFMVTPAL